MLYFLRRTFEQRTRVREAIPMPEALIDLRTFALEEYKAIQAKINQFRDTAGRLETFNWRHGGCCRYFAGDWP